MSDTAIQEKPKRESFGFRWDIRTRRKVFAALEGYAYLAPTLIILTIFVFIPIITSFQMSLTRVAPFGNRTIDIGLEHYTDLLTDARYFETIKATILFAAGSVPIGIILATGLAIALSYPLKKMSGFYRLLIFIPIVISTAVTGVLFSWIYHPVVGYLNYMLSLVGVDGPNWLTDKDFALMSVMFAVIWRQLGFNTIIALAGIQNIDEVYYEAAKVDGANLYHRVRHIMIPLLTPTLFFLLVINVINSLQVFGEINILTQGGPGRATSTMLYSIYYDAFVGTPYRGLASAQAYLLFMLILVLSLLQFSSLAKKVHYQ
jgi:sn-glycerol 3-phosphate transport system permease protein